MKGRKKARPRALSRKSRTDVLNDLVGRMDKTIESAETILRALGCVITTEVDPESAPLRVKPASCPAGDDFGCLLSVIDLAIVVHLGELRHVRGFADLIREGAS